MTPEMVAMGTERGIMWPARASSVFIHSSFSLCAKLAGRRCMTGDPMVVTVGGGGDITFCFTHSCNNTNNRLKR